MHQPTAVKATFLGLTLIFGCAALGQNGPQPGDHEIQVWLGGGHSVPGGKTNIGTFNLGLRYGWILTGNHGPGVLNGGFEYVVDAVPAFVIFQPANSVYGVAVNPLGLKWNFARRGRLVPYFELGGGALFTNYEVPSGTSSLNFTPEAALGMARVRSRFGWSLEVRYVHISNAGLSRLNPGINTVQVRWGLAGFRH